LGLGLSSPARGQELALVAGGDVEWSRIVSHPDVFWDPPEVEEGDWHRIPYLNRPEARGFFKEAGQTVESPEDHHLAAERFDLSFDTREADARYPLEKLAPVFRSADVAYVNLEMPLSDRARRSGAFRGPTSFAAGLAWAGVDVVSTANNHALDAEGVGLLDTVEALKEAGVASVGTGPSIAEARAPFITEANGVRVAFLAYASYGNAGTSAFATEDRSGMAPLDPLLIAQDIERVRAEVDHVVLSFHWGLENTNFTHPDAVPFARAMLDAGARVILGHGPHLPQALELRDGKLIAYSMGNLIFGHGHDYWGDNLLLRIVLGRSSVLRVEAMPVAGTGSEVGQPFVLTGPRAQRLLEEIRSASAALGTTMTIEGDVGVIRP
jgi:poly-gamma-glutamate synthesis protein (capsule biosynthesis protein)